MSEIRESLQVRIYPAPTPTVPTVVYLPGLHGDWTLISACREILRNRVRFVEVTYPRSVTWTLTDYAAAIEEALLQKGVGHAWILGESFGSQVLWELVKRGRLHWDGLILAGGFVNYPYPRLLSLARALFAVTPPRWIQAILPLYAAYARVRYRGKPELIQGADEFVRRRTPEDLLAWGRRLELIANNDPRSIALANRTPVHHLYGFWDPIVPWMPVASWLHEFCPALRGSRRVTTADHTVLATGAEESAQQICQWISGRETPLRCFPRATSRQASG